MKKKLTNLSIFTLWISFLLLGCGSDDQKGSSQAGLNDEKNFENPASNPIKLLSAEKYVEKPDQAPDYSAYYTYENGYLASASGFTTLEGSYFYDGAGKLTSSISREGHSYTYLYDSEGRMLKSINEDNGEEIDFVFSGNKVDVVWKRASALADAGPDDFYFDSRELILDELGRITVINNSTPDDTIFDKKQEFFYDDDGNIVKAIFENFDGESYTQDYTYSEVQDPFYSSFKKFFESTYYLINFFSISPTIHDHGLSPHVRVRKRNDSDEYEEYSVDDDGYLSNKVYSDFFVEYIYE